MATSTVTELQTDFIKCPICLEILKNPKYLTCLHTFCEGCISTYITSALENPSAQKEEGISCPTCHHFDPIPTDTDSKEWASRLPSNDTANMMLDFRKATDKPSLCSACERENKTESATSWCANCSETLCDKCVCDHRKFKMSASHAISSIENLEHDKAAALRKRDIFCQTHKDEKIKIYCIDHSTVCCMSCVLFNHKKCDNVLPIEEAANAKRETPEYSELEKCLFDMGSEISCLLKEKEKSVTEFCNSATGTKNTVKDVRRRLNAHLDKMERDCIEKISQIEKETVLELENQNTEVECKQAVVQNDLSILKNSAQAIDALFLSEFDKLSEHKTGLQTFVVL